MFRRRPVGFWEMGVERCILDVKTTWWLARWPSGDLFLVAQIHFIFIVRKSAFVDANAIYSNIRSFLLINEGFICGNCHGRQAWNYSFYPNWLLFNIFYSEYTRVV